jgi:hypothetical protein
MATLSSVSVAVARSDSATKLKENFALAETISKHVHEKIPMMISNMAQWPQEVIDESRKGLASLRECEVSAVSNEDIQYFYEGLFKEYCTTVLAEEGLLFPRIARPSDKAKCIETIADIAESCGLGTSREMSALGLSYCQSNKIKQNAELFYIKEGNQCFLVIDRNKNSEPNDYAHWGDSCVVCDLGRGENYTPEEIPRKLYNFQKQVATVDGFRTVLEQFNPRTQTLACL